MKTTLGSYISVAVAALCLLAGGNAFANGKHQPKYYTLDKDEADFNLKLLGKYVFFDENLSAGRDMGCVTCHQPRVGGVGDDSENNLGQVAITGSAAPGLIPGVSNRKPQTNMYSALSPPFDPDANTGGAAGGGAFGPKGGNFWDGRSTGRRPDEVFYPGTAPHLDEEVFHDIPKHGRRWKKIRGYAVYFGPTSDQALNPMQIGPEQNLGEEEVCRRVAKADYAPLYRKAWGRKIDCSALVAGDTGMFEYKIAFRRLMLAVGAYQHSKDIMPFSAKRDRALRAELACLNPKDKAFRKYYKRKICRKVEALQAIDPTKEFGKFPLVALTDQENLGHDLFYNQAFPFGLPPRTDLPVTNCSFCHSDNPDTDDGAELLQTYTDRAWHNIGTPFNPELPHNNLAGSPIDDDISTQNYQSTDHGLDLHTDAHAAGFFQTPTVRNVAKGSELDEYLKGHEEPVDKAFMHNGYFKDLLSVVEFYNSRDTLNLVVGPPLSDRDCQQLGLGGPAPTVEVALENDCWPDAEFPDTQSPSGIPGGPMLVGNIGLSEEQKQALVAYMVALTDEHTALPPPPYRNKRK